MLNKYKYLDEKQFWDIMDVCFSEELDIDYAAEKLSEQSEDEIIGFHNTLAEIIERLQDIRIYDADGSLLNSSDAELYVKCFIVANGQAFYNEILADAEFDASDEADEFEDLLDLTEDTLNLKGLAVDYHQLREIV